MKAARRLSYLCVCVLVGLLVLSSGASAKPGYYVVPGNRLATFQMPGSNGYRIIVIAQDQRYVSLSAFKGGSFASYTVRSRFKDNRIETRIGSMGLISVRFEPTGAAEREDQGNPRCKGRQSTTQAGNFVGTIRFHGERGFTTVDAIRARGDLFRRFRLVCARSDEGRLQPPPATSLIATSRSGMGAPTFTAYKVPGVFEIANYTASAIEKRPDLTIARGAQVNVKPDAFLVSDANVSPTTAFVDPPFPFSGSATFQWNSSGQATWLGTLGAELPGRGEVRLAGPSFSARLCRNLSCACNRERPCLSVVFAGRRQLALQPRSAGPLRAMTRELLRGPDR